MRWCIFAWKSGCHCFLYIAYFLLNDPIRLVLDLWNTSASFPLYYDVQTTTTYIDSTTVLSDIIFTDVLTTMLWPSSV